MEDFCNSFRSSAGHVKVGCLQSFSQLFAVHGPQHTQAAIEKITEHIFHNMGGEGSLIIFTYDVIAILITNCLEGSSGPVDHLISLAQQPVEEMRVAAFAVLESIATQEWGQRELTQSKKFLDYILNRTTESTHSGKVRTIKI